MSSDRQVEPPFGIPPDLQELSALAERISPGDFAEQSRSWNVDLLDQLAVADLLWRFLKKEDHAFGMYQTWLSQLDLAEHPQDLLSDIAPAFANLAKICMHKEWFDDALIAFRRAHECGCHDPYVKAHLAILLQNKDPAEARRLVEEVLELPEGEILQWLSPGAPEALRKLQEELGSGRAKSDSLTLRVLRWGFDPELRPPSSIFNTTFDSLVEKGAPPELVAKLRSAVIFLVSPDRKVWYTALFRELDPTRLYQQGSNGDLQVWFFVDESDGSLLGMNVVTQ